jgi:hypothetical protein
MALFAFRPEARCGAGYVPVADEMAEAVRAVRV